MPGRRLAATPGEAGRAPGYHDRRVAVRPPALTGRGSTAGPVAQAACRTLHPMTMAILTGVALLSYGVSLYLAGSPGRLPQAQ